MIKVFDTVLHKLFGDADNKGMQGFFLKGTVSIFAVYIISYLLAFVLNYLLIHIAGTGEYGIYVYALNLVTMIAGFSVMGTDNLLVKNLPVYKEQQNSSLFKSLFRFSLLIAAAFSIIAGLISLFVFQSLPAISALGRRELILLFLVMLPMIAVITVYQASFQALSKPILSQLAEKILRPVLFILVAVYFMLTGKNIGAGGLITAGSIIVLVAVLVLVLIHRRSVASQWNETKLQFQASAWMKIAFVFFLLDLLYNVRSRADIFLLGIFRNDPSELAACNIVLKLSEMVGFGLLLVNILLAPLVSRFLSSNEKDKLQHAVTFTAKLALAFSLPVFAFLLLFGNYVLGWFQVASAESFQSLVILCCAQLLNVMFGSVGVLLSMSGNQKASVISLAVSMLVNIVLDIILIPANGIIGVAIASATGLLIWNMLMYFYVKKKIGITTTALKFI